tara:strand:+ start:3462 stop:3752 length:291 start_codon:yes stop_codon:yes gene_type:complete
MRTLTINYGLGVENRPDYYGFEVVDECGRTTGALCLGELIEQVTCMVHPKLNEVRYAMVTPEQWAQRWSWQPEVTDFQEVSPVQHTEDPDHGEHLA